MGGVPPIFKITASFLLDGFNVCLETLLIRKRGLCYKLEPDLYKWVEVEIKSNLSSEKGLQVFLVACEEYKWWVLSSGLLLNGFSAKGPEQYLIFRGVVEFEWLEMDVNIIILEKVFKKQWQPFSFI